MRDGRRKAEGRGRGRELPRSRGEGEGEFGPRRKVRTERGVDMGVGGVSWCHRAEVGEGLEEVESKDFLSNWQVLAELVVSRPCCYGGSGVE